jgi:hypothetical protein
LASVALRANDHRSMPKRRVSSVATQAASGVGSIAVIPPTSSTCRRIAAMVGAGEWPAIAPVSPSAKST